jgi:hypothetical protein
MNIGKHPLLGPGAIERAQPLEHDRFRDRGRGRLGRPPLVPSVAVFLALMLVAQAIATIAARDGHGWSETVYWLSVGTMVLVVTAAQLSTRPTARERLAMAIALGLALYGVKLLANPAGLTYFDELSHARTALDIANTGQLLHENPLLPISPYFPGLEIVAVSLSKLTGLSLFASGVTAIGVGRVILVAALYALFTEASESRRIAGVATVVYMANPSFLYFDAGFSYESFALPLSVAALVLTLRWMRAGLGPRALALLACTAIVVAGLVPTHHLTSYLFAVLAIGLCICALLGWRWGATSWLPWPIAVLAVAGAVAWAVTVATPVYDYLEPILRPAVEGVAKVATGNEEAHKAFSAAPAPEAKAPFWLRTTAFASILLILACLPFGLLLAWRRRSNPATLLLAAIAFLYVPTLVLRIAGSGVESANRSSGLVFLGISFVIALLIEHVIEQQALPELSWRRLRLSIRIRRDSDGARAGVRVAALAAVMVLFVGGVTVFWPPYSRLPGPYLAGTDLRAVSQQGIAAARWMRGQLGPGHEVLTDRTNGQIAGAYGEQNPVGGTVGELSVSLPFTSSILNRKDMRVLRRKRVEYLIVDTRLSNSVPIRGWYFSSSELYANPYTEPIPLWKLIKFDHRNGINLIYDDGAIRIYDVRELTRR